MFSLTLMLHWSRWEQMTYFRDQVAHHVSLSSCLELESLQTPCWWYYHHCEIFVFLDVFKITNLLIWSPGSRTPLTNRRCQGVVLSLLLEWECCWAHPFQLSLSSHAPEEMAFLGSSYKTLSVLRKGLPVQLVNCHHSIATKIPISE